MGCTMMGGLAAWPLLGSIIGLVVLAVVIAGGIWLGRRLLDATSQPVNDQPGQVDADSARGATPPARSTTKSSNAAWPASTPTNPEHPASRPVDRPSVVGSSGEKAVPPLLVHPASASERLA
jgi:hypothetical protein